jgi:hypothetical protein
MPSLVIGDRPIRNEAKDPRLAFVAVASVLGLNSVRGLTAGEIARQIGATEKAMIATATKFRNAIVTGVYIVRPRPRSTAPNVDDPRARGPDSGLSHQNEAGDRDCKLQSSP